MINFVTGKPGGGKSLFSVRMIVDELRCTSRNIATNVALKMPDLLDYLNRKYGQTFNAIGRVRILTNSECLAFWRFPALGIDCNERVTVGELDGKKMIRPDFSPRAGHPGTLFLIDEIHEFFASRQWATTGQDALFYCSQHRKLQDDLICISQAMDNVEKQFRSVAQDFTILRNMGLEMIGGFRLPKKFLRRTYLDKPTPGATPSETAVMSYDIEGLMSCYDTAAGVGILGRDADKKHQRRRGWPTWCVIFPMAGLAAALYFFPYVSGWIVNWVVSPHGKAAEVVAKTVIPGAPEVRKVPVPVRSSSGNPEARQSSSEIPLDENPSMPILGVVGLFTDADGNGWAWLSDGSSVRIKPPRVSRLFPDGSIELDGRIVPNLDRHKRLREAADGDKPRARVSEYFSPDRPVSFVANPSASFTPRVRVTGFQGESWKAVPVGPSRERSLPSSPLPDGESSSEATSGRNEGPPETHGPFVSGSN